MTDKYRVGGKEQKEKDTEFIEMVSTSGKEIDRQTHTHREKEKESESDKESKRWRQEKWKRRVRTSLIKREGD